MIRGVRARLTTTIVALVVLTAAVLGIGSYLFVDTRLHGQAVDDARDQARFDLAVLAPPRLGANPTEADVARLAEAFQSRRLETIIDAGPSRPYTSTIALAGVLPTLPADLRSAVGQGQIAYAWLPIGGVASLVVGGPSGGTGPAIYFVRDERALEATLDQLRLALGVGALVLAILAIVAARFLARGVLAPVEAAGRAAERIERGDLSARVPVTSNDEFGTWADRFNRMAAALDDTIARLEAAQTQNRRFVADVSHELRTPVSALVAEASILREHLGDLPQAVRRAGELVVEDIARLRTLVEELMELSRFDAESEEVQSQPVDLGRLIRDVVAARHRDAVVELPDDRMVIETDPRRLERILANLLGNANEHASGALVVVRLRANADWVTITVADRGPGVPADRLDRIFDRFFMADPSRRGGSGLGLAIAREHAELLGGRLRARNRDGGGLAIELVLPVTGSLHPGDTAENGESDAEGR
ncbi:MAG TPA: HAMP domain-containing sensor histidine kinase [Candidatus Limnocylindrales bacterium]|nr:HAMP domain-containing sensor histidine kinase [Candidatus Limnocylindrales bacterium]